MRTIDPRVARILEKLSVVRRRWRWTSWWRSKFSTSTHRYRLASPLGERDVRALEHRHGIELPEAYRTFITQAGASGAGPYYGLLPPSGWGGALTDYNAPDFPARPCPWTPEQPRDTATWERASAGLDEPYLGAITIGLQGCSYYSTLVVTGPARGRVMYLDLEGAPPFFPENPDFLSWYERWLDELIGGVTHDWFGMQMPGDEAALAAAASPENGPRRLDALRTMFQLPGLSAATRAVVAARVRDEDPMVRAAATGLVTKFALASATGTRVRRALTDRDACVRDAALLGVIAADGWPEDVAAAALVVAQDRACNSFFASGLDRVQAGDSKYQAEFLPGLFAQVRFDWWGNPSA